MTDTTRSNLQNNSLHKYCQQLADELNAGGYTYKVVLNKKAMDSINELNNILFNTPMTPPYAYNAIKSIVDRMERELMVGDMQWSMDLVKNALWRFIQIKMFDIYSTTKISTKQCMQVYDQLSQLMAESFGINVGWPCQDTLMNRSEYD